jgi:hypothetical protein
LKSAVKKQVPFQFVLDLLFSQKPTVKPMFGSYGVYIGEKIVLVLRNRENSVEDNGVWVALYQEHQAELKKLLPSLTSVAVLVDSGKNWQVIPSSSERFEEEVTELCELILKNDNRIGKVPEKKKKAAKT